MSNTKIGLRAFGLSFLAVLGFMAFAAAGAQGQLAGKFLDLHTIIKEEKEEKIPLELAVGTTATGAQEGKGSLLVAKLNIAIECETADVEEGVVTAKLVAEVTHKDKEGKVIVLIPHTAGTAHATIKFLVCIVKTAALATIGCAVEGGSVKAKVKLLAMLASAAHGEVPFVLAEPLTAGTPFATIKIINAPEKFCAVTGTYEAKGSLALKVLAGHVNPQLVVPFTNQALLGDELLLGTNPAVLDASATIEITGPEALKKAAFGVC